MSTEPHMCDRKGSPAKMINETGHEPQTGFYLTCSAGKPQVFESHVEKHSNSLDVALKRMRQLFECEGHVGRGRRQGVRTRFPCARRNQTLDGSDRRFSFHAYRAESYLRRCSRAFGA